MMVRAQMKKMATPVHVLLATRALTVKLVGTLSCNLLCYITIHCILLIVLYTDCIECKFVYYALQYCVIYCKVLCFTTILCLIKIYCILLPSVMFYHSLQYSVVILCPYGINCTL